MMGYLLFVIFIITNIFAQNDYYNKNNLDELKQQCKKSDKTLENQHIINQYFYSYARDYNTDKEVIEVFLKDCKADINYESVVDKYSTYQQMPPLFKAIDDGEFDLVKLYIKYGANINQDTSWRSPLRFGVLEDKKDSFKIFSYLLKKGANPNYKDASGVSIITTIARATFKDSKPKYWKKEDNRKEELLYAKELLKYNVIVTKEDIQWAKKNGKTKLYKLLVDYYLYKK